jgi:TetR/AcrR family transcriptional regulator
VKNPPPELADKLLDVSEQVLRTDAPPRLEDVARLVGASRATLYYYFAGRDAVDPADPPDRRLRAMIGAMVGYLAQHPGICSGLLGALGGTGQMTQALQANETWIAGPLRDLLTEGREAGVVEVGDVADAANAILGAILLAVLGRMMSGAKASDGEFQRRLTEQALRGVWRPA